MDMHVGPSAEATLAEVTTGIALWETALTRAKARFEKDPRWTFRMRTKARHSSRSRLQWRRHCVSLRRIRQTPIRPTTANASSTMTM
jgi:hypothetical protein